MPDPAPAQPFPAKLLGIYTGAVLTKLIDVGYQTGLFEASRRGAASSDELAERAGLNERYVREWLGAMTTGGIYTYDARTQRDTLPDEHAVALTGSSASNLCPTSRIVNHFGSHLPALVRCFCAGGGIPYSAYRPVFTQCMDDSWRRIFDQHLVPGFIGAVPGLTEWPRQGIAVLDVGCGTGHAMNILAREFPQSTFLGYDIADDAIASANAEARQVEPFSWSISSSAARSKKTSVIRSQRRTTASA
jgi:Methyltransferase domain